MDNEVVDGKPPSASCKDIKKSPSTFIPNTGNIGSASVMVFGNLRGARQGTLRGCLIYSLCGDLQY